MAKRKDWVYDRGTTWKVQFRWKTAEGPYDITGYRFKMQAKATINGEALLTLDTELDPPFIEILDAENGEFRWTIDADMTEDIKSKEVLYDLYAIAPNGESLRLLEGKIVLSDQVTTF